MKSITELLREEENRLSEIKKVVDSRLLNVPEGTLRITTSGKKTQYIHCIEALNSEENISEENISEEQMSKEQPDSADQECNKKEKYKLMYITKNNSSLAMQLAQKAYDQKVKKLVDKRLKQISALNRDYEADEIEAIYNKLHPNRRSLVKPVEIPWEQKIAEWKSIPYSGKEFSPGMPEIYTKKGERVRSKSEKILADTFYELGIEYKYECPIKLKGYGIVYPDFTFLRKRDCKEIYWEHDGRMDDPVYAEKAIRKINSYMANELFPGDRLIISYESTGVVINDKIIKQMISQYLVPFC